MSTPILVALGYVASFAVLVSCGFWLVRRHWPRDEQARTDAESRSDEFPTARVLVLVIAIVVVLDVIGTLLFLWFASWVA